MLVSFGWAYATAGDHAATRQILDNLERQSARRFGLAFEIASLHQMLDEPDRAFAWLERAYQERIGSLIQLRVVPAFDAVHHDPRYLDLVHRLRLPDAPVRPSEVATRQ